MFSRRVFVEVRTGKGMAFCGNCGNQLADDERFCTKCGADRGAQAGAPGAGLDSAPVAAASGEPAPAATPAAGASSTTPAATPAQSYLPEYSQQYSGQYFPPAGQVPVAATPVATPPATGMQNQDQSQNQNQNKIWAVVIGAAVLFAIYHFLGRFFWAGTATAERADQSHLRCE